MRGRLRFGWNLMNRGYRPLGIFDFVQAPMNRDFDFVSTLVLSFLRIGILDIVLDLYYIICDVGCQVNYS